MVFLHFVHVLMVNSCIAYKIRNNLSKGEKYRDLLSFIEGINVTVMMKMILN